MLVLMPSASLILKLTRVSGHNRLASPECCIVLRCFAKMVAVLCILCGFFGFSLFPEYVAVDGLCDECREKKAPPPKQPKGRFSKLSLKKPSSTTAPRLGDQPGTSSSGINILGDVTIFSRNRRSMRSKLNNIPVLDVIDLCSQASEVDHHDVVQSTSTASQLLRQGNVGALDDETQWSTVEAQFAFHQPPAYEDVTPSETRHVSSVPSPKMPDFGLPDEDLNRLLDDLETPEHLRGVDLGQLPEDLPGNRLLDLHQASSINKPEDTRQEDDVQVNFPAAAPDLGAAVVQEIRIVDVMIRREELPLLDTAEGQRENHLHDVDLLLDRAMEERDSLMASIRRMKRKLKLVEHDVMELVKRRQKARR